MEPFGNYLLQMAFWLAGFWLVYVLTLRRETFFRLNRWFLLAGLVVSVVLPLFPVRYQVETTQQTGIGLNQAVLVQPTELAVVSSNVNIWLLVYLSGVLFFLLRYLWQVLRLARLRKTADRIELGSLSVFRLESETAPFSFFRKVYVSKKLKGETELKAVLAHEKVHIDERHWADLLVLEVVRALQWFNPLLIFYRRAVMQNHEYLADLGTLQNGVCARTYQAVLVNQMLGVPVVQIANGFTLFNPTKRIFMMNKNKTMPVKRFSFLWAIPVAALIVTAFARPEYVMAGSQLPGAESQNPAATLKGKVCDENHNPLHGASIIVANSTIGTLSGVDGQFSLSGLKPDDEVVISFVGYETVKVKAQNNIEVKMKRKVVAIEVTGYGNTGSEMAPPPPPPPPPYLDLKSKDGKKPLIHVDGKAFEGDINSIDPNSIEKVEVLKDQSATALYGKKGENGVVLITTKKQASPSNGEVFVVVEEMPQFKGGPTALKTYLEKATAGSKGKGVVKIQFTVAADGSIKNTKVIESPSKELGAKATRIILEMPDWIPGTQRGKAVTVDYVIQVEFN